MIYSIGEISGAHINPAVTVSLCNCSKISNQVILFLIYLAQLTGALTASFLIRFLFPADSTLGRTIPSGSVWQSFILEILLSMILMFVILRVSTGAKEKSIIAGIAVGSVVALEALFAGPISGASMNPARSIAPGIGLTAIEVFLDLCDCSNNWNGSRRPFSSNRCLRQQKR